MADKPDKAAEPAPKKKGGAMKMIIFAVLGLVLVGGGVAGGLYSAGGLGKHAVADNQPKLVPKSEQEKPKEDASKSDSQVTGSGTGMATPEGAGGDRYASTYYSFDKDFTANLQESAHFIQVGLAVSTPYDAKVIDHIKGNEIAIRSAVLMALGDTNEDQVFTSDGKRQLQARLVKAINATLEQ
jgi:flagellar protein FliL